MLATQNPLEMEGTYPLPEAQLDRFFYKLMVPFPSRDELHTIIDRTTTDSDVKVKAVLTRDDDVLGMQKLVRRVPGRAPRAGLTPFGWCWRRIPGNAEATDLVKRFVRTGAFAARRASHLVSAPRFARCSPGASPRPIDDVRATALPALRHRILRSFEGEAEGVAEDKIIDEILKKLPESKA